MSVFNWFGNLFNSSNKTKNEITMCCPNCKHHYNYNINMEYKITFEPIIIKEEQKSLKCESIQQKMTKDKDIHNDKYNNNFMSTDLNHDEDLIMDKPKTELSTDDLVYCSSMTEYNELKKEKEKEKIKPTASKPVPSKSITSTTIPITANITENTELNDSYDFDHIKELIEKKEWRKIESLIKRTPVDSKIFEYIILNYDDLTLFDKLRSLKFPWDTNVFVQGVKTGSKKIIDYLILNDCPYSKHDTGDIYEAGLSYGLDLVKYLKSKNIPMPRDILELAIDKKSYDSIEWLLKNGCKFTEGCFEVAISKKDIVLLETLKINGCPWGKINDNCKNKIQSNPDIYTWLENNNCLWIEK